MFFQNIKEWPLPPKDAAAEPRLMAWLEAAARSSDPEIASRAARISADPTGRQLLEGIFGGSPFLSGIMAREPDFGCRLLEAGPDLACSEAFEALEAEADTTDRAVLTRALRRAKARVALAVAVGDVTGAWSLEKVTNTLSELAERCLDLALSHLLAEMFRSDLLHCRGEEDQSMAAANSGVFVLGMGKLGARELNYSSDIDLIFLYDEEKVRTSDPDRLNRTMVRLARSLVALMEERTADGYVFRTDLRLRPDPASTPLAMSTQAAEIYYESMGQNWERAAMLKARVVAGDRQAGERFLLHLRPFVWRRSLDFEAIRDIHSIKRQINAFRGGGKITVAGHNLKLGRGGIREIEFYAQTQQLIWGGRNPDLRVQPTCDALRALAETGHIDETARDDLIESYRLLRRTEHRLQMVADQQTHTLPAGDDLKAFARFCGFAEPAEFEAEMRRHLERVESHYAELFEEEQPLGAGGNLVFTGADDDPDTLETLRSMGFTEPKRIASAVRGWHHGRYRATRSVRARELLTELMPAILGALARTPRPDESFGRFDRFLSRLPAGVQLFSLFHANPGLLDLVAEILGSAPHLAEHLSRHPVVLDAVLAEDFFEPPAAAADLASELAAAMAQALDFQDILDIARRWTNDRKFQIGVQLLRGRLDPLTACRALSDVADAVIGTLLPHVEEEFAQLHGRFDGDGLAIVAFGKLGSREMTITSDIDLVALYDAGENVDQSDGAKPLPPGTYFIRLTQRLTTAITTLTGEGKLYDIDMRLRPFGDDGPLAAHVDTFETYESEKAWTWEHMALIRARVIAGPPALRDRIDAIRTRVLTAPRDPDRLVSDVASMRARMARAHPARSPWAIKHRRGGLVDVEFLAQYLVLKHAADQPELVEARDTARTFELLRDAGILDDGRADALIVAARRLLSVQSIIRLTGEGRFEEEAATSALRDLLANAGGADDFADLERDMEEAAARVVQMFEELIAEPAARLAPIEGGEDR